VKVAFGININNTHKGVFVISAFVILFSATMAEIMRSAYLAVDKGQTEAALSIGLSPFQAFKIIVLPQAIKYALPNFANSLITLIKEGSLAYTVGLIDIMGKGTLIIGKNYGAYAIETYLALAIIYWIITIVIEKLFNHMETTQERKAKKLYKEGV
ncbi:MAG: ABC transporter permease subunit, partial [Anaerotignaceae bacterium]